MDILKFEKAEKAWRNISKHAKDVVFPSDLQLEIPKGILNRFHPGPYYYYVFNVAEIQMEFVSKDISTILGYEPSDFSAELVLAQIHPNDTARFLQYEEEVTRFFSQLAPENVLKYKVCYDYRLRCANGRYKWILQQVSTIQSLPDGAVVRVLGIHTDITNLKRDGRPMGLSFIGYDGMKSYYDVRLPNHKIARSQPIFSDREKQILQLVLQGKNSHKIAEELFISPHTVSVHRKNLLRKTNCSSFLDIAWKIIQEGWSVY